ncbi:MAG: hypothetical protein LAP13_24105 [Acidobacteriia bacterium]|nr:hypothetical protein [Terriglobia bacterium]
MNRLLKYCTMLSVFLALGLGVGHAQQSTSAPSLGDLARKLKAQRAQEKEKPKLYTNDNLPARPAGQPLSVAAGISENAEASKRGEKPEAGTESKPAEEESANQVHNEKYYRAQMAKLQGRLSLHQRELDVLQQKLGQNEMQYYPDPQKTLDQQYTRGDINKLQGDIDKKKQQIAADERAIEDLRDQLRREGGDPGWLR